MNSLNRMARRAGALYLLFLVVGLFDMFGFSGFLVPGDATATARNIVAAEWTYRLGILTDLVTLLVFIFLVVSLYNLFKDVDTWHAMLMVLLVSVGVSIGCVNILNKVAPLILLRGAVSSSVFSKPQLDALAMGFLDLNNSGNDITSVFWGLWLFPFGVLVIKSGFLPRVLGMLLLLAGLGYVTSGVTSIILPAYSHIVSKVAMPLLFGEFPIIFWLLIKGAKEPQSHVQSSSDSRLPA
ncbi:MAG: DUF4386 domain-containing protein [Ignavibacteria bacterium]|nr:DUF4386 domain-containing protein [Ignavibacteria bacterium]